MKPNDGELEILCCKHQHMMTSVLDDRSERPRIDPGNWWEVPWFHDILFAPVRKTPLWSPLDTANWCQVEKVVGASAFHSPLSLWCGQVFWVGELESLVCDLPKRWGFERLRKSHDDAHDPQERKAGMIGVHVCMHTRICIWWAVDLEILVKIYSMFAQTVHVVFWTLARAIFRVREHACLFCESFMKVRHFESSLYRVI